MRLRSLYTLHAVFFWRTLKYLTERYMSMGKRKDLTERERYAIEAYRNEKRSIKEISILLGRHYQTIYREIKRGTVAVSYTHLTLPTICSV